MTLAQIGGMFHTIVIHLSTAVQLCFNVVEMQVVLRKAVLLTETWLCRTVQMLMSGKGM